MPAGSCTVWSMVRPRACSPSLGCASCLDSLTLALLLCKMGPEASCPELSSQSDLDLFVALPGRLGPGMRCRVDPALSAYFRHPAGRPDAKRQDHRRRRRRFQHLLLGDGCRQARPPLRVPGPGGAQPGIAASTPLSKSTLFELRWRDFSAKKSSQQTELVAQAASKEQVAEGSWLLMLCLCARSPP